MFSVMRHSRVKTRIIAGFGLLVACAAGMAGFGAHRLVLIRDDVSLVDTLVDHVTRLDSIMLTIEAMRGAAPRFKPDDSEAAADTVRRGIDDVTAALRLSAQEVSQTEAWVEAIKVIARMIDEINVISGTIAAAMDQPGACAKEIAMSAQEAAAGTASVVASMAEVWQGTSATGSAAGQVLSAATAIGHRTLEPRAEVGGFLGKMRAA